MEDNLNDLKEALRKACEHQGGLNALKNDYTAAMLDDFLPGENREKKIVKNALRLGAGKEFCKIYTSFGSFNEAARAKFKVVFLNEIGMADEAYNTVADVFWYAADPEGALAEIRAEEQRKREETERKEAEERARKEAEEKARREAEEKARKEAEERARKEAEEKARREAEEKAKKEAEERKRENQQTAAPRETNQVQSREDYCFQLYLTNKNGGVLGNHVIVSLNIGGYNIIFQNLALIVYKGNLYSVEEVVRTVPGVVESGAIYNFRLTHDAITNTDNYQLVTRDSPDFFYVSALYYMLRDSNSDRI